MGRPPWRHSTGRDGQPGGRARYDGRMVMAPPRALPTEPSREDILAYCGALADAELGGTLATTHAEDGTPYVTYVLFHLRDDGSVVFGTGPGPQHTRNML